MVDRNKIEMRKSVDSANFLNCFGNEMMLDHIEENSFDDLKIKNLDEFTFYEKSVFSVNPESEKKENNKTSKKSKKKIIFRCVQCDKTLLSKSSLKLHSRIHTNEKPYKCEDCGMKFRWCTSYKNHLKNHKKNLPQCPVAACGRKFSMKKRLENHFQSVHIQMLEPLIQIYSKI